jgi:hypothetical protein
MKNKIIAGIVIAAGILLFSAGGYMGYTYSMDIYSREQSVKEVNTYLTGYVPSPFENSALVQEPPSLIKKTTALHSYKASESLVFSSYSKEWDETKLKELHQELLKNKHGKEMETLHEVVIWPQEDKSALATHSSDVVKDALEINFGALPYKFQLNFFRDVSLIDLYGGDKKTTIESMAWSLSHEYGHLYTFYYMLTNKTGWSFGNTKYAQLRKCTENELIPTLTPAANYLENHYKYLFEVAAEDYVQLMGSPTTRQVVDFVDIRQRLNGADALDEAAFNLGHNAYPQENLQLPLANEVEDLPEFFYSFIKEKVPEPIEQKKEIKLTIQSGSRGHDLTIGYRNFVYYNIEWNKPYKDAIYTLVSYDPNKYQTYPIKTVHNDGTAIGTIGTVSYDSGGYVQWTYDEIDRGTKVFLVIAQLPDGTYYSSEPLEHTF